jgi:cytochrome c553
MRQSVATARRMGIVCRAVFFGCLVFAAGAAQAQGARDPARGAVKAKACEACHGTAERPPLPGTPWLAGQQTDYLELQMFLFREGLREAPQMAGVLKGVTDNDFLDMGAYFSRQQPPKIEGTPDPRLRARGAELAKTMGCGTCHLGNFRGQKQIPRLDRQREDYLVHALKSYRDNKRTGSDTNMNGLMYKVPDGDIQALAHFLAHHQ